MPHRVTLSAAKGLSRWAERCFASLSMTAVSCMLLPLGCHYTSLCILPDKISRWVILSRSNLINDWLVSGQGDRFAFSLRSRKPGFFSDQDFSKSLLRSITEGRAILQIRDIGNISFVFLAVEDVNVIIFHDYLHPREQIVLAFDIRTDP